MDITPVLSSAFQLIQAYGESGFTIAKKRYEGAVAVFAEETLPLYISSPSQLTKSDIENIASSLPKPEIVLIGTGRDFLPMPLVLKQAFRDQGISSSDAMDTGAACRTFNVLLAEGRRVAAILFPYR